MPPKAEINFLDFDLTLVTPRFQLDIGSNTKFRVDVGTGSDLFSGTGVANRTSANYARGSTIESGTGTHQFTLPISAWNSLNLAGGRLHYRLTSWTGVSSSRVRSVPLTPGTQVPFFDTNIPPDPPVGVSSLATSATSIDISWSPPTNPGSSSVTNYSVEVSNDGISFIPIATLSHNQLDYTHAGLFPATLYYHRILASNNSGLGSPSNQTSANTSPPTITISVERKRYGFSTWQILQPNTEIEVGDSIRLTAILQPSILMPTFSWGYIKSGTVVPGPISSVWEVDSINDVGDYTFSVNSNLPNGTEIRNTWIQQVVTVASAGPIPSTVLSTIFDFDSDDVGDTIHEITVQTPELEYARRDGILLPYKLATDEKEENGIPFPRTQVIIHVNIKDQNDNIVPASFGTRIKVGFVSADNPLVPLQGQIIASNLNGDILSTDNQGQIIFDFQSSTNAARWRLQSNQLDHLDPDSYHIVASSLDGTVTGQSERITVVAGTPKNIAVLSGPDEIALNPDNILTPSNHHLGIDRVCGATGTPTWINSSGVPQSAGIRNVKLSGFDPYDSVVFRSTGDAWAQYLAALVIDYYGNPVPINQTHNTGYWTYFTFNPLDTDVLNRPFLLQNETWINPSTRHPWITEQPFERLEGYQVPGVFQSIIVPSHRNIDREQNIRIGVLQYQNNSYRIVTERRWRLRSISTSTSFATEVQDWFFYGETEGFDWLLVDLIVGFIPYIGDGHELFRYGMNWIDDRELDHWDHAVALLSLCGLTADILTTASLATLSPATGPTSIFAKIIRSIFRFLKRFLDNRGFREVLQAISALITRALSPLLRKSPMDWVVSDFDNIIDLGRMMDSFTGKLIDLIRNLDVAKFKTIIGIAGLCLLGGMGIEALFNLFKNYTIDEALEMLWLLALMDGEE